MTRPLKKIPTRKRHFQLLELMVAAFILLICVAPSMRIFTSMYQSQQDIVRENQRDHLAHLVHAKFTEQLYKRIISLPENKQSNPIELGDPDIQNFLKQNAFQFSGTFTLESRTPKGQEKPSEYLGKLEIKLKDTSHRSQQKKGDQTIENRDPAETSYDYYVYIKSGEIDSENNNEKKDDKTHAPIPSDQDTSDFKGPTSQKQLLETTERTLKGKLG